MVYFFKHPIFLHFSPDLPSCRFLKNYISAIQKSPVDHEKNVFDRKEIIIATARQSSLRRPDNHHCDGQTIIIATAKQIFNYDRYYDEFGK